MPCWFGCEAHGDVASAIAYDGAALGRGQGASPAHNRMLVQALCDGLPGRVLVDRRLGPCDARPCAVTAAAPDCTVPIGGRAG